MEATYIEPIVFKTGDLNYMEKNAAVKFIRKNFISNREFRDRYELIHRQAGLMTGTFSIKNNCLAFCGLYMENFTHESIFKAAVTGGFKESMKDEYDLVALENESHEC